MIEMLVVCLSIILIYNLYMTRYFENKIRRLEIHYENLLFYLHENQDGSKF